MTHLLPAPNLSFQRFGFYAPLLNLANQLKQILFPGGNKMRGILSPGFPCLGALPDRMLNVVTGVVKVPSEPLPLFGVIIGFGIQLPLQGIAHF